MADDVGTLAVVVQQEAGEGEKIPSLPNRAVSEMAHVGVKRFGTGHAQHDGTEDDNGPAGM